MGKLLEWIAVEAMWRRFCADFRQIDNPHLRRAAMNVVFPSTDPYRAMLLLIRAAELQSLVAAGQTPALVRPNGR